MDDKVKAMVQAVKDHAAANYDRDGWDYVVETYTDEEIAEVVKRCRTPKGAIKKVLAEISPRADYRDDVQKASGEYD